MAATESGPRRTRRGSKGLWIASSVLLAVALALVAVLVSRGHHPAVRAIVVPKKLGRLTPRPKPSARPQSMALPASPLGPSTGPSAGLSETELAPATSEPPVPMAAVSASSDTALATGPTASPGLRWQPIAAAAAGGRVLQVSVAAPAGGDGSAAHPYSSLNLALQEAHAGDEIHLAPGNYPQVGVDRGFAKPVTITGDSDSSPPVIAGADLVNASDLIFNQVEFSTQVSTNGITRNIELVNSEIDCSLTPDQPNANGLLVRGGTSGLVLDDTYVHNCQSGLGTVTGTTPVSDLIIEHSVFENFKLDGIDIGDVHGARIDHDIVRGMDLPGSDLHHDGIQFYGADTEIDITNDVIANSRDQLLLIQDAIAPPDGDAVNRDIVIANDLLYAAGGYAVQVWGTQGATFSHDTFWNNYWGSVLVTDSSFTHLVPHDVSFVDCLIQGLSFGDPAPPISQTNTFVDKSTGFDLLRSEAAFGAPGFTAASEGDYSLGAEPWRAGPEAQGAAPVTRSMGITFARTGLQFGEPLYGTTS
jgi:Right handed beta helix region